jgi:hypothetical protein
MGPELWCQSKEVRQSPLPPMKSRRDFSMSDNAVTMITVTEAGA